MKSAHKTMMIGLVAAIFVWGTSFSPPLALAQELQPKLFLTAYDAKGNTVGMVHSFLGNALNVAVIALQVSGVSLPLLVAPNQFSGNSHAYFESTDCSGAVWVKPAVDLMPPTTVLNPGNTFYVADLTRPDEDITTHSVIHQSDPQRRCFAVTHTFPRHRTFPLIDLNTLFTPPFTVR